VCYVETSFDKDTFWKIQQLLDKVNTVSKPDYTMKLQVNVTKDELTVPNHETRTVKIGGYLTNKPTVGVDGIATVQLDVDGRMVLFPITHLRNGASLDCLRIGDRIDIEALIHDTRHCNANHNYTGVGRRVTSMVKRTNSEALVLV